MIDKELQRQLINAMNATGAGVAFISGYALMDGNAAMILGRVLKAFKLEAFYAHTFPFCLIFIFALGIGILSLNFIGIPSLDAFFRSDDIVTDEDVKNGVICKLKGYAWDSNDFSRGWLITGKTGSGKTVGAIMHLMRQVFLRCSGKYEGIPKWGGVAVDQKGDFWEIVEHFAKEFKREDDLVMLKTRRDERDAPPRCKFNLLSYKGVTRATYAQLVIDCSKSVAGGRSDGEAFWDNSARNAIESSFHLTDAMERFLRPANDGQDNDKIMAAMSAANRVAGQVQEAASKSIDSSISSKISVPLNEYAQLYREFDKHKSEEGVYPEYARLKEQCLAQEEKLKKLCVEIDIECARKAALEGKMGAYIAELSGGGAANPESGKASAVANALRIALKALTDKKDVAGAELEIETFTSLVSSYRMLTDMAHLERCLLACENLLATEEAKKLMPEIMRKETIDACKYLGGEQFMRNAAKETLNSIISFISNFLKPFADPYMREVYCAPRNTCEFSSIDEGKIFTVSMPQAFGVQRRYANTIMKLLFYQHALNRFDADPAMRPTFNNLIFWADEAQGVVTASPNMSDFSVVDRTRAAKATVVFAAQSVTSFLPVLTQDQVKVLLLNLANQIHFQAADEDGAKFVAEQIGKSEITERTYSLSKGCRTVNLSKKEQHHIRDFELMAMKKFHCVIKHCESGHLQTCILPTDFSGEIKKWKSFSVPQEC
jgi:hypothetical protein